MSSEAWDSDATDSVAEHCAVLKQAAKGQWDSAADELLLRTLEEIQKKLFTRLKQTGDRVDNVYEATSSATTQLENTLNSLELLAHKQFVQHRVADDDDEEEECDGDGLYGSVSGSESERGSSASDESEEDDSATAPSAPEEEEDEDTDAKAQRVYDETVQMGERALQRRVIPLFQGESDGDSSEDQNSVHENDGTDRMPQRRPLFAFIGSSAFINDPYAGYVWSNTVRSSSSSSSRSAGVNQHGNRVGHGLPPQTVSPAPAAAATALTTSVPQILTRTQPPRDMRSGLPAAPPAPSASAAPQPNAVGTASTGVTKRVEQGGKAASTAAHSHRKKKRSLFDSTSSESSTISSSSSTSAPPQPATGRQRMAPGQALDHSKESAHATESTRRKDAVSHPSTGRGRGVDSGSRGRKVASLKAAVPAPASRGVQRKNLFGSSSSSSSRSSSRAARRALPPRPTRGVTSTQRRTLTATESSSSSDDDDDDDDGDSANNLSPPRPSPPPIPSASEAENTNAPASQPPAATPSVGSPPPPPTTPEAPPASTALADEKAREGGAAAAHAPSSAPPLDDIPPPPVLLFEDPEPPSSGSGGAGGAPPLPSPPAGGGATTPKQPPLLPRRGGKVLATSSDED